MAIGKMRHRITLQQPVEVTDAGGGRSITWSDVETIWAEVKPLRGTDRIHAMGSVYPVTHRMTIRHRTDVQPEWRVSYDSRLFNIHFIIDPDERKNYQVLNTEEGMPTRNERG